MLSFSIFIFIFSMIPLVFNFSLRNRVSGLKRFSPMVLMTATVHTPTSAAPISNRVKSVRAIMEKEGVQALVVPTDDPHMSEYTASYFARREFLSGFTGSAGTVVVTLTDALLFTDGRYHTQAAMELPEDGSWTLMRSGMKDVPTPVEYLAKTLPEGSVVGIDPLVHSAGSVRAMKTQLLPKGISVKGLESNPVDAVWGAERPPTPAALLRPHPLEFAGVSVADKLRAVREEMGQEGAGALVLTVLDEIAYLFNFRSSDVPCNPVSICYAVVTSESAFLFIDANKVGPEMREYFSMHLVQLKPYEQALPFVKSLTHLGGDRASNSSRIWIDGKTVNQAFYSVVEGGERGKVDKQSPLVLMKARKNDQELAGMRNCHLRDGAAVAEFFCVLEEQLTSGKHVTEVEVDTLVTRCRAEQDMFLERSFSTICGVNEHGAIMHYRAEEDSCSTLTGNELVLLDSGAQYEDGTTDVTRTFHTGTPTDFQREMFTRVLKGNIAVDKQTFPENTPGCLLDSFARQFLWEVGKNYLHGTGHGVGAALNVHEGPHRISPVLDRQPLMTGMIVSNEPGYYPEGDFGIRLENLLEVVAVPEFEFAGRGFLGFRRLTHIPFQRKMLAPQLLTAEEVRWLDQYHREVRERVSPFLKTDRAREWLTENTKPIEEQVDPNPK